MYNFIRGSENKTKEEKKNWVLMVYPILMLCGVRYDISLMFLLVFCSVCNCEFRFLAVFCAWIG